LSPAVADAPRHVSGPRGCDDRPSEVSMAQEFKISPQMTKKELIE